MAGHSKPISKEELWGGGQSPFSVTYGKMMMWFFLVSDALTFGGLLTAYGVIRHGTATPWPVGEQVFEALPFLHGSYPLIYVALMTFILIVSSVTMVLAVEAGHRLDKKGVIKWLGLTIVGGFFFVGSQAWEWSHFIHGSGGGFQISKALTVKTDSGKEVQLNAGTWVHMSPKFGHEYEHALEAAEDFTPKSHAPSHGHDDHGHGDAHAADAHHADISTMKPDVLIVNKYVRTGQGEDAVAQQLVTGSEMEKIWNAREQNTFAFGANMSKNEYGPQQYANFFFFVTGFHGFHVFSGVVINIIIWLMVIKGAFDKLGHYEMIEKIGLYWHFVDLVWVFVFTFYYLV
jgi:cytochrome c oxidase subunit III